MPTRAARLKHFAFTPAQKKDLRGIVPAACVGDLARALGAVNRGRTADMSTQPGERGILRVIERLLSEFDQQFGKDYNSDPEWAPCRRWLEERASVARKFVQARRSKARRSKRLRKVPDSDLRPDVEQATLAVLRTHSVTTGAARVLAIAVAARLGVPVATKETAKRALARARKRPPQGVTGVGT